MNVVESKDEFPYGESIAFYIDFDNKEDMKKLLAVVEDRHFELISALAIGDGKGVYIFRAKGK
jgi:hypothetical protein